LIFAAALSVGCAPSTDPGPFDPLPTERTTVNSPSVMFDAQGNRKIAHTEMDTRSTVTQIDRRQRLWVGGARFATWNVDDGPPGASHYAVATNASGTTLAVFLTGPLDPLGGNAPGQGVAVCRSTTASPTYGCERPIPSIRGETAVAVALNDAGSAVAIVNRQPSSDAVALTELFAMALPASGRLSPQLKIADTLTSTPFDDSPPSIVLGNDGSGQAMYIDRQGRLVARRYLSAFTQWLETTAVAPDGGNYARLLRHPAAPENATLALWREPAAPYRIQVLRWQGAAWQGVVIPPPPCWGSETFDAAMNASGEVVVAWACENVVYASHLGGSAWSAPVRIDRAVGAVRMPRVGIDGSGNAVAVWVEGDQLISAPFLANGGWQPPAAVGTVASLAVTYAYTDYAVGMSDSGRAVAAWTRDAVGGGTRLATAEVGPFALQLTAPRHAFGGDALRLTLKLAVTPTQPVTIALSTTLPAGSLTLPSSVAIAANQSEFSLDVPTRAVNAFTDGDIVATYSGVRSAATVTLMPEPTSLTLTPSPARVIGGTTATLDIVATPGYPASVPIVASLASDNPTAQVPAQVALGSTGLARVTIVTSSAASEQSAVLTARVRGLTATTTLQIAPTSLAQAMLTVAVAGSGSVASAPAGINCGSDCSETYPLGTRVTLNPLPAAGQRFYAWSGDADCSDGVLTMSAARACTAVFLPTLPPYPEGLGWAVLGAPLTLASEVDPTPSLARDTNHPVVAYVEALGGDVARLFVKRLEGASFVTLGGGALNAGSITAASEPSLVTTTNGQPFVAWIQGNGIQQNVFVARFNGTAWESVGPPGIPLNYVAGSTASRPALALDAENQPLVAWLENGVVKLKRFDGTAWVAAPGGEGPAGATGDQLRLSTDLDGVPVLAWRQPGGGGALLKVVRGLMFEPLGTSINAPGTPMTFFDVKAEVGGATAVLSEAVTPVTVRRQRWNGSAWVFVAGPIVSNDPRPLESLVLTRGFQSEVVLSLANTNDNSALMSAPGVTSPFGTTYAQRLRNLSAVMVRADSPIVAATQSPTSGRYEARVWRFYP
jgi:hypothetical protein